MKIHLFNFKPHTNNDSQRELIRRFSMEMGDALLRCHGKKAFGAVYPELGYPKDSIGETWLCLDAGPWACRMDMYLLDDFSHSNGCLTYKVFAEDFRPLPERSKEELPEVDEGESHGVCGYISLDSNGELTIQLLVLDEPGGEDSEFPSWDPVLTATDTKPTLVIGRGTFYCTIER